MVGSAMLLPECRARFEGIEAASSISWNPHKWLGSVLETSLFYVKAPEELVSVMATGPSYLRSQRDGEVVQYRDWGLPLGRRFRALRLWALLRLEGAEALRARMRRDLENAARLAGRCWHRSPSRPSASCTRLPGSRATNWTGTRSLGARR